ncbi:MAG TPA: DUF222 domain-containing protein [Actinomycetota bacterium]|nr:DUF222 domain-containing protein [Actinomycetota bacterium]
MAEVDDAAADRDVASLIALADSYLAGKTTGRSGGDAYHLNVHVDADLLANPDADAMLVTQDGARLSQATLERILCDCSITALLEKNGETIDVGRKTRRISPALRRALNHRDRGCTFPGCTQKAGVDAHHTDPWAAVPGGPAPGKTKLGKLASGCRFHHTLLHVGEFKVEMIDGKPKWFDRLGRAIPDSLSSRATGPSGPERNAKRGLIIDETTCASEWDGSYVDYDSVWAALEACSSGAESEEPDTRDGPGP